MRLLSRILGAIQGSLIPCLEEKFGSLTDKQKKLVEIIELVRIEDHISDLPRFGRGRPSYSRAAIARAFIAKAVLNFPNTRALVEALQLMPSLRRICGFEEHKTIPHESVFSRAFSEFSLKGLPQNAHESLVRLHCSERLIGHISRDSTEINAREKPTKKMNPPKPKKRRRRGRPINSKTKPKPKTKKLLERQIEMTSDEARMTLPMACDIGAKSSSKGHFRRWIGYKLHIDSADGQIPISCILTSASLHDSQAAIPLAKMSAERVTSLYDLMDSAYDSKTIRDFSRSLGHVPIIDFNKRRNGIKKEMEPATSIRHRERTNSERVNSRLKDDFGGRSLMVRGGPKVFAHLMFGILALTADQLIPLLTV
ncbi:MAG: transposase [Solidesulfovibrio sp. DCME]|uniref:transposase n=1 Tax=Solidesulfovibrio sp. DCME TaxID=3447380 RepID=UPI003D0F482F